MRPFRVLVLGLIVVLILLSAASFAGPKGNGNPNPGVIPPQASAHGNTYGEWGDKWWQWAYSIPWEVNPMLDETGALAGMGQSGPVFFLAGVINVSGTAERTITIPPGKTLFFPILNFEADNVAPPASYTIPEMYDLCNSIVSTAVDLHASLDGKTISNLYAYRGASPSAFPCWMPDHNIFQYFGFDVPEGTVYPMVSDGYWLMLAPLPPGNHTLNFGGTFPTYPFTLDITYHINVVPGSKK